MFLKSKFICMLFIVTFSVSYAADPYYKVEVEINGRTFYLMLFFSPVDNYWGLYDDTNTFIDSPFHVGAINENGTIPVTYRNQHAVNFQVISYSYPTEGIQPISIKAYFRQRTSGSK